MRFWALVPARGGSKSVPLKNLKALAGRPLLDYGVLAACAWGGFERIVCSTDHAAIAQRARELGIEVDDRPAALAGDDAPVAEVAREFLARSPNPPDWLFLVQPTSPFLLPAHIAHLTERVQASPAARSAQTVAALPHNHHAWNQRLFEGGEVQFVYAEERRKGFNKQRKRSHFAFGNLVAARTADLAGGGDFFASPSAGVEIERPYDLDVDSAADFALAEALVLQKCVALTHLTNLTK